MPYADPDMRLVGNIPARAELELAGFYDDAADEIDAILGSEFDTPVTVAQDGTSLPRTVSLILRRVNRFLATGRYILAVTAGGEDTQLQAYGASLIREALTALQQILSGTISINAKRLSGDASRVGRQPAVSNTDAASQVDTFYNNFTPVWEPQQVMRDVRRWPYNLFEFAERERGE